MPATRTALAILLVLAAAIPVAAATPPSAEALVGRMIDAAGGPDAFASIGVLKLVVDEEETLSTGRKDTRHTVAYAATPNLQQLRMELGHGIVVAADGPVGWATIKGKLDERPQSSMMAQKTLRQTLFPLLLPFSLRLDGVLLGPVEATRWDGAAAWQLRVDFKAGFFASPMMQTSWRLVASAADGSLLAADFQPPTELAAKLPETEGMRYRFLKRIAVGEASFPAHVLIDGIDAHGVENGHVNIVRIAPARHGAADPSLFAKPAAPPTGRPTRR